MGLFLEHLSALHPLPDRKPEWLKICLPHTPAALSSHSLMQTLLSRFWQRVFQCVLGGHVVWFFDEPLQKLTNHLFSECTSVSYPVMMLVYAYSGKKIFDPLLILFVCPLTKKWSVISFNGRFIWTVRDRKQHTKKSRKTHLKKSYELICILMSEISIWPLHKTWLSTWWQNPCWQSQRSDVSCSWPPSLRTSQEGFCPTPLCRFSPSH